MAIAQTQISKIQNYIIEYANCKKSFDYFCRHYIYIELPGNDVLLQPYVPQTNLINTITKDKMVLVLKSRQIGISTIIQAYCTWLVTFYKNIVSLNSILKDAGALLVTDKTKADIDLSPENLEKDTIINLIK